MNKADPKSSSDMDKGIVFHAYALHKMERRGITRIDVEETMATLESIVAGRLPTRITQRICREHLLRVVFEEHEDHYLVMTAYPARPQRYPGR